jgi:hypothetical protein
MSFQDEWRFCESIVGCDTVLQELKFFEKWRDEGVQVLRRFRPWSETQWQEIVRVVSGSLILVFKTEDTFLQAAG